MCAVPKLIPLTEGAVAGDVAPGPTREEGATVATIGLSLTRFTVTPFAGAGERFSVKPDDWLGVTEKLAGKLIVPSTGAALTVTLSAESGTLGNALAWITVDPPAPEIPVTGTETEFVPARIVAVAGTVATAVLSELRLTVRFLGVTLESVRIAFCVAPPEIGSGPAGKLSVPVTFTATLLAPKPAADAPMDAVPIATPVITGAVTGFVVLAGIVTIVGLMLAVVESELLRLTTTSCERLAGRVMFKGTV